MSDEEMKAELERLRNENASLKKGAATGITMKVSEKGGAISLRYGTLPDHALQRAVAEAAGYVGCHPIVYC